MKCRVFLRALADVDIAVETLAERAEYYGWVRQEGYRGVANVWRAPDAVRGANNFVLPEIIIPTTEQIADYDAIVGDLVIVFSLAAGKTILEMLADLSTTEPKLTWLHQSSRFHR